MLQASSGLWLPEGVNHWRDRGEPSWDEGGREQVLVTRGPNLQRLDRIAGGARVYYRQYQEPAGFTMITDASAATGTAEALLWPANFTSIPAQALVPGQHIEIHAYGVATTPGSAATTMTINPRWGTTTSGVTLGISNTSATVVASQTAVPWWLNFSQPYVPCPTRPHLQP